MLMRLSPPRELHSLRICLKVPYFPAPLLAITRPLTISNLVILNLGDVDQNLRGGVVERDALEDGRAVVGDRDLACGGRMQDFVHSFRSESRLDEVSEGERSDKGGETGLEEGRRVSRSSA